MNDNMDGKIKQVIAIKSNYKPQPYDFGKVRIEGARYVTVRQQEREVKTHIKKLDKYTYKVLKTGEVRKYESLSEKEKKLIKRYTLHRTFGELSGILNANFVNEGDAKCNSQLFLTLTYAENMMDVNRLYKDFEKFRKRLVYRYRAEYKNLEYVCVMEPQGRGAWHVHMMLKDTERDWLWIDQEVLNRLWPHGYTDVQRLRSNDIGAYYIAYFTCLISGTANESDEDIIDSGEEIYLEEKNIQDLVGSKELSKKLKKSARLEYYPKNFKFYRCSKGIVKPEYEEDVLYEYFDPTKYDIVYENGFDIIGERQSDDWRSDENPDGIERELLNRIYRAKLKRRG